MPLVIDRRGMDARVSLRFAPAPPKDDESEVDRKWNDFRIAETFFQARSITSQKHRRNPTPFSPPPPDPRENPLALTEWAEDAMDWNAAIETNRQALKRVLASLVAMAGITGGGGAHRTATLPRILHRTLLRLLRPAEAAARRLVIVAARGLVVTLRPPRARMPKLPATPQPGQASPRNAGYGFQLFDPLPRPRRPRRSSRSGVPRICFPGLREPFPVPRPPSADDLVDAGRLTLRLTALASALDDLPRQARRFARWRAARDPAAKNRELDAAGAQSIRLDPASAKNTRQPGRIRRVWPLRPGRPLGARTRPTHEVHDILETVHGLAVWAMEKPDTS